MVSEIERISSPYNDVIARRRGDWIDLDVKGATHASWHPRFLLTGYSWDALCAACMLRVGEPRSVLLLGLGGGTCLRPLRRLVPEARIVAVEIDTAIVDLARRHMAVDDLRLDVQVTDAFKWLKKCTERFDVVIDDLFLSGSEDVERSAVPEGDWLRALRDRTTKGGVVVCNLITDASHRSIRRRARAAFSAEFGRARVVTPPRGFNEVLVGGDDVAPPRALRPYTSRFAERRDRERWAEIAVRLLPR